MTPTNGNPPEGIDMKALCRVLARMLVLLDESEYTEGTTSIETQQADVYDHTSLPDQASGADTRRANH
ncbi:MAG: hypothetical protein K8I82_07800 [Anaerolineae bacterium]|nr:hypothetical protein [Anaerolineae bacterium]